jgi:hypothetical protein
VSCRAAAWHDDARRQTLQASTQPAASARSAGWAADSCSARHLRANAQRRHGCTAMAKQGGATDAQKPRATGNAARPARSERGFSRQHCSYLAGDRRGASAANERSGCSAAVRRACNERGIPYLLPAAVLRDIAGIKFFACLVRGRIATTTAALWLASPTDSSL